MSEHALKILFATEANSITGMGHLMRCCAVASALRRLVQCSCHFEPSLIEQARKILSETGETSFVEPASHSVNYDIVITDLQNEVRSKEQSRRFTRRLHVWVEDEPRRHSPQDVVFQPNVMQSERSVGTSAFYSGREFIILHPAYQNSHVSPPGEQVRRIVLCFGGSDPANLSMRVTRLLPGADCAADYRLILGPLYQNTQDIHRSLDPVDNLTILQGLANLASELRCCDLAVLSGGTLLYEACALGRPAIILSQNELQSQEAAVFSIQGAVSHLGRHDLVTDIEIQQAIRQLCGDPKKRYQQAEAAARLVPLGGATRVAERILHHYSNC